MYAQYLKERTNDEIIETTQGFVSYRFLDNGKTLYIVDIYILPDYRLTKAGTAIADRVVDIARAKGCVELIGTICPGAKHSTESLKALLAYGMTLKSAANDVIIMTKEIK
jgi:GNAT superfamily N-acetyltransferase